MKILSYFHGVDPAAAVVVDGEVLAYVEEERLLRNKHAVNLFPIRSIGSCLDQAGLHVTDLDLICYGWDAERYGNGEMQAFYDSINRDHEPDSGTIAWQQRNINLFTPANLEETLHGELLRAFGVSARDLPPMRYYPHHAAHAASAFYQSPYDEALVLTLDGSGDSDCTVVWRGKGATLTPLHRHEIPNSLGWFYAAITEYLGFEAYDGEYKVMGLAAYGEPNEGVRARLEKILSAGPEGFDYVVDPSYIHHGAHTWSGRYTDRLPELLGQPPRLGSEAITPWHESVAYETQQLLEETVTRLVSHFAKETGLKSLCVGGGVALNVKMNSILHKSGIFDAVWAHPIPSDSGLAMATPVAIEVEESGQRPPTLTDLYLGPGFQDEEIESQLQQCGLEYSRPDDIADETARLLSDGLVVGWFQGRMEGGPRALGNRSILADPRTEKARDRVNGAVKFREYWRPFCPSLTVEAMGRYLVKPAEAPFMILAFDATDAAREEVPAVVHVDGTMRCQTVSAQTNPRYHALLQSFEKHSGVPVLLNTSFNVKGEAIVCTPRDAIRTFFATGLDALAIGAFIVRKPRTPIPVEPDGVAR